MCTWQLLLYPTLIFILILFLMITVPRKTLRTLLPYGVVLGGLVNALKTYLLQNALKLVSYKNLGVFACSKQMFLAPLAWVLVIVFYLYFWPKEPPLLSWSYCVAWAVLATAFSQVVKEADLFSYVPWFYPLPMFLVFLARFAFTAWLAKPWRPSW